MRNIVKFPGDAIGGTLLRHRSDVFWVLKLYILLQQILIGAPVSLQEVQGQQIGDVDVEVFLTVLKDERGHG